MKTTPLKKLKADYEECCNQYVLKFANKQGLTFEGWVGDAHGGWGLFGNYTFSFHDILHDVNTKQPKGLIVKWQDEGIAAHFYDLKTQNMSYQSYTKGMKFI